MDFLEGESIKLVQGDCLEVMKDIPDGSVNLILTDPPYGLINCEWDSVINLDLMWAELKRISKKAAVTIMFSTQPFTTKLISSNMNSFKFEVIWDKAGGMGLNAKKMPIKSHENILIFYDSKPVYNAQMESADANNIRPLSKSLKSNAHVLGDCPRDIEHHKSNMRFPKSVRKVSYMSNECNSRHRLHPTQKPIELLEWLVSSYSNEGDTVLDFTMGSGSTGVASKNLNRRFIGVELDPDYFAIAKNRIENT